MLAHRCCLLLERCGCRSCIPVQQSFDLGMLAATCGKLEQIRAPPQRLSLLCCALQLLADAEFHDKKVCPEATASVLSLVTFAWVGRLMRAGYK